MAAKVDVLAEKQAKQKKLLIVLAVVLAGALAFQLPKLLGGSSEPPAAAPAAPADTTGATASSTTGTTAAPVDLTAAGNGVTAKAGVTQLASFSLFETKDPFVQGIVVKTAEAATTPAGKPADGAAKPGTSGGVTGGGGTPSTPAAPGFATISVNGVDEPIAVKGTFPQEDPLFVLVGLKPKLAKIGIAGGTLDEGKAATLRLGKKLTLVNNATGARYTLELHYVGTEPEQIEGFTSGEAAPPEGAAAETTPAP